MASPPFSQKRRGQKDLLFYRYTLNQGNLSITGKKGYDNSLAENLFSILKTECIHQASIATFEEARQLIEDYIYFYNYQRIQFKTKLTPLEKRRQFAA